MRKEPSLAATQEDKLETYAQSLRAFDYSSTEIEISGTCLPAKGKIPGDYVGVVRSPEKTRIVTVDGMGKGVEAFRHARSVAAQYFIGAHRNGTEPTLHEMSEHFAEASLSGRFFFSAFMLIEIAAGERWHNLTIYGMGQPSPLIYRQQPKIIEVLPDLPGVAIGVPRGDNGTPYSLITTYIKPGDIMLAFSDGATEARDRKGRMFANSRVNVRDAFLDHASDNGSLEELVREMVGEVRMHCTGEFGKQEGQADEWQDDITFVAIRPMVFDESREDL